MKLNLRNLSSVGDRQAIKAHVFIHETSQGVSKLVKALTEKELIELLFVKNHMNRTMLHMICKSAAMIEELPRGIFSKIDEKKFVENDNEGFTPLEGLIDEGISYVLPWCKFRETKWTYSGLLVLASKQSLEARKFMGKVKKFRKLKEEKE